MPGSQISFRIDPRVKALIRELVASGEYRTVSDFMNEAVLLTFAFERIPVGGELIAYDPIAEFFGSYGGRQLLRELMQEVQAE